jgi:hypothetical protein
MLNATVSIQPASAEKPLASMGSSHRTTKQSELKTIARTDFLAYQLPPVFHREHFDGEVENLNAPI